MKIAISLFLFIGLNLHSFGNNDKGFPIGYAPPYSIRAKTQTGNLNLQNELIQLLKEADLLLKIPAPSVLDQKKSPEGVDPHNYVTYAPYWWPNPNTKNGLPYVRKDGVINKKLRAQGDDIAFTKMANSVYLLGLAYFYTQEEKYSKQAANFITTWFLNPETKMNPNVKHGQIILGKHNLGRRAGINELRFLPHVIDAIPLIQNSKHWSKSKNKKLKLWFKEYLKWLIESEHGKKEKLRANNHGTWYDVQIVSIALFTGNQLLACKTLENETVARIESQIANNGMQPLEVARTRSLHYSIYNVRAYFALASMGERLGVDLWNFKNKKGCGIQDALDYLIPFIGKQDQWPHKDLGRGQEKKWALILNQAISKYGQPKYIQALRNSQNYNINYPAFTYALIIPQNPKTKEWNLVWEDHFNGSKIDTTKWSKIPQGRPNWSKHMSNNPLCYELISGELKLKGIKNPDQKNDPREHLTGGIYSKGKFSLQYGKIEIRAKFKNAQGAWPALWLKPDYEKNGAYQKNGEIDIMEHLNHDSIVYQTLHSYYTIKLGEKQNPQSSSIVKINPTQFNTYGLEWYPDRLVFITNGIETLIYPKVENESDSFQWPFDKSFYILIDQQLGGGWVGEIEDRDLPAELVVDYVKVYQ